MSWTDLHYAAGGTFSAVYKACLFDVKQMFNRIFLMIHSDKQPSEQRKAQADRHFQKIQPIKDSLIPGGIYDPCKQTDGMPGDEFNVWKLYWKKQSQACRLYITYITANQDATSQNI